MVVGIERDAEFSERAHCAAALCQPLPVHAVARAEYVAAGNALVGLHQVKRVIFQRIAGTAREAPVAPYAAEIEWVANQRLTAAILSPLAGKHGKLRPLFLQGIHRVGDKALGAAEIGVA